MQSRPFKIVTLDLLYIFHSPVYDHQYSWKWNCTSMTEMVQGGKLCLPVCTGSKLCPTRKTTHISIEGNKRTLREEHTQAYVRSPPIKIHSVLFDSIQSNPNVSIVRNLDQL